MYHFIFVPLTLSLSYLVAIMQTERGTHAGLVRAGGVYHRLWQAGRCADDRP